MFEIHSTDDDPTPYLAVPGFEIAPDGEAAPVAEEPAPDEEETLDESDQVPTVKLPPDCDAVNRPELPMLSPPLTGQPMVGGAFIG